MLRARRGVKSCNTNTTNNNHYNHSHTKPYHSNKFSFSRREFSSSKVNLKKDERDASSNKRDRKQANRQQFSKHQKTWGKNKEKTSKEQSNEAFSSLLSSISKKPERKQDEEEQIKAEEEGEQAPTNITDLFKKIKPQADSDVINIDEEDTHYPEGPEYSMGEDVEFEYEDEPLPEKEFQMQSAIENEFETALPSSSRKRFLTKNEDKNEIRSFAFLYPDSEKRDHIQFDNEEDTEDFKLATYSDPEFSLTLAKENMKKRRFRDKDYSPLDPDPDIPYSPERRIPDLTSEFNLTSILSAFEDITMAKMNGPESYHEDQVTRSFLLNKLYSRLRQTRDISADIVQGFNSEHKNVIAVAKQIQNLCEKRINSVVKFAKQFDCQLSENIPEPLDDVVTENIGHLKVNPLPYAQHFEFIWLISHDLPRDAYLEAVKLEGKTDKKIAKSASEIVEDVKQIAELCNQLHLHTLSVDKGYQRNCIDPPSVVPEQFKEMEESQLYKEADLKSHPSIIYNAAFETINKSWPEFPLWEHIDDDGLPGDILEAWDRAIRIIRDDNVAQENWFSPYVYDLYNEGSRGKVRDMIDFIRDEQDDDAIFEAQVAPPNGSMTEFDPLGVGGTRSLNSDILYDLSNLEKEDIPTERAKFIKYFKDLKKTLKLDPNDIDGYVKNIALDKSDLQNIKKDILQETGENEQSQEMKESQENNEGQETKENVVDEETPDKDEEEEDAEVLGTAEEDEENEISTNENKNKKYMTEEEALEAEAMELGMESDEIQLSKLRDELLPKRKETPPPPDVSIPANILESGYTDDAIQKKMKEYIDWESQRTKNSFLDALEPLLAIPMFPSGDIFNNDYSTFMSRMADNTTLNTICNLNSEPEFTPFETNEQRYRILNPDYNFRVADFVDRDGALIEVFNTVIDKKKALEDSMFPAKHFESDMALGGYDVHLNLYRTIKEVILGINTVELFEPMSDLVDTLFRFNEQSYDLFGLDEPYEDEENDEEEKESQEKHTPDEKEEEEELAEMEALAEPDYKKDPEEEEFASPYDLEFDEYLRDPEFDYYEDQGKYEGETAFQDKEKKKKAEAEADFLSQLERLEEPEFEEELGTKEGLSMPFDILPMFATGNYKEHTNPKGVHELFGAFDEIEAELNYKEYLDPMQKRVEDRMGDVIDELMEEDFEDEFLDDQEELYRFYSDADFTDNIMVEQKLVDNNQRRIKRIKKFKAKRDQGYWDALKYYQDEAQKLAEDKEAQLAAQQEEEEEPPDPEPEGITVSLEEFDEAQTDNDWRDEGPIVSSKVHDITEADEEPDIQENEFIEDPENFATEHMNSLLEEEEKMDDVSVSEIRNVIKNEPEKLHSLYEPIETDEAKIGHKVSFDDRESFTGTISKNYLTQINDEAIMGELPSEPAGGSLEEEEEDPENAEILEDPVDLDEFLNNPWLQNPVQDGKNWLEHQLEKGITEESEEETLREAENQGNENLEDTESDKQDHIIDTSHFVHVPHVVSGLLEILNNGCVLTPHQISAYLQVNSNHIRTTMDINARETPLNTDFLDSYDLNNHAIFQGFLPSAPKELPDIEVNSSDYGKLVEIEQYLENIPDIPNHIEYADLDQINECFRELGIKEIPEEEGVDPEEIDEDPDLGVIDPDKLIEKGSRYDQNLQYLENKFEEELDEQEQEYEEEGDFYNLETLQGLREIHSLPSLYELEQQATAQGVRLTTEDFNRADTMPLSALVDASKPEEADHEMMQEFTLLEKLYDIQYPEPSEAEEEIYDEVGDSLFMEEMAEEQDLPSPLEEVEEEGEEEEQDKGNVKGRHREGKDKDTFFSPEAEEFDFLPDETEENEVPEEQREAHGPGFEEEGEGPEQQGLEEQEKNEKNQSKGFDEQKDDEDEEDEEGDISEQMDDEQARMMSRVLPSIFTIEQLQPYVDNIIRKQQLDYHVTRPYIQDVFATRPAGKYHKTKVVAPYDKYFDDIVRTVPEGNLRDDLENVARAISKNTTIPLPEKKNLVQSYRDTYLSAIHDDPADYLFSEKMDMPTHLHDTREITY